MTVPILKESYHMNHNLVRRDSMFSAFRMGQAASGRGQYDIGRVYIRATQSRVKKLRILERGK